MKTPRGTSESSTTSDNTMEFIDIVKKYDIVYNTHNPDYKNVEVKMKVWLQIAEEIGLSVDASKRKWKNLRDSYTKYLRSFRVGSKTSKKYKYWAHAEHMDFLKPYQGPGRHFPADKTKTEEPDCDFGFQVLTKVATTAEEDVKIPPMTTANKTTASHKSGNVPSQLSSSIAAAAATSLSHSTKASSKTTTTTAPTSAVVLPVPSLPTVELPPQLTGKHSDPLSSSVSLLPQTSSGATTTSTFGISSSSGTTSTKDKTFKKEGTTSENGGAFNSKPPAHGTKTTSAGRMNLSLVNKVRRIQPSQTSAINLSFAAAALHKNSSNSKTRLSHDRSEIDLAAILHANRDLDANTLFFLSLARTVRMMPTKFQSLAKMRCMRAVSDIELELDNISSDNNAASSSFAGGKYCNMESPPTVAADFTNPATNSPSNNVDAMEHFVYDMSPSRLENMIDVSSDEDTAINGT